MKAMGVSTKLVSALLGLAGVILVIFATKTYGPGVGIDSVNYISTAQSVTRGGGFTAYDGKPYVYWPPLYPALLAAIGKTGLPLTSAARFLNALAFGFTIFLSGLVLARIIKNKAIIFIGVLSILLSPALLSCAVMAWSEPLFVCAALLFFLYMPRFIEEGKGPLLAVSAAAACAACMQRYTGATIVITGCLSILLLRNQRSFWQKIKNIIIFAAVSIIPLAAWLARNLAVTGTLTGVRNPSTRLFAEDVRFAADTISAWVLPAELPLAVRAAAVGILALAALFAIIKSKELKLPESAVPLIFAATYMSFIMYTSSKVQFDALDDRLLLPIFPVFFIFIFKGAESVIVLARERWKKTAYWLISLAGVIWLAYPSLRIYNDTADYIKSGAGEYSTAEWQNSPVWGWVRANFRGENIWSNAPDAIYYFTGARVNLFPRKKAERDIGEMESLLAARNAGESYIVWMDNYESPQLLNLDDISKHVRLKEAAVFAGAKIYSVTKK